MRAYLDYLFEKFKNAWKEDKMQFYIFGWLISTLVSPFLTIVLFLTGHFLIALVLNLCWFVYVLPMFIGWLPKITALPYMILSAIIDFKNWLCECYENYQEWKKEKAKV